MAGRDGNGDGVEPFERNRLQFAGGPVIQEPHGEMTGGKADGDLDAQRISGIPPAITELDQRCARVEVRSEAMEVISEREMTKSCAWAKPFVGTVRTSP